MPTPYTDRSDPKYFGSNLKVFVGENSIDPDGPVPKIVRGYHAQEGWSNTQTRTDIPIYGVDKDDGTSLTLKRKKYTGCKSTEIYFQDELSGSEVQWCEEQVNAGELVKVRVLKHPLDIKGDVDKPWGRNLHPYDIFEQTDDLSSNANAYTTPTPVWNGSHNVLNASEALTTSSVRFIRDTRQKLLSDILNTNITTNRDFRLGAIQVGSEEAYTMPDAGQFVFKDSDNYFVDTASFDLTDRNGVRLNQVNSEYGSVDSVILPEEEFLTAQFRDLDNVFWGTLQSTVRTAQFIFTGYSEADEAKRDELNTINGSLADLYEELDEFVKEFDREDWEERLEVAQAQYDSDPTQENLAELNAVIAEYDNYTDVIETMQEAIFELAEDIKGLQSDLGVENNFTSRIWCMPGLEFTANGVNPQNGVSQWEPTVTTPGGNVQDTYGNRVGGSASPPTGSVSSSSPWPNALSYTDYPSWGSTTDGGANTELLYKIEKFNRENVVDAYYDLRSGWMRFAGWDYGAFPIQHGGGVPFWQGLDPTSLTSMPEWATTDGDLRDVTKLHADFPDMIRFGEYGPLCVSGGAGVSNKCVSYPQRLTGASRSPSFIDLNSYKVADFLIAEEKDYNKMLGEITERMPGLSNLATESNSLFFGFNAPTIGGVQVSNEVFNNFDPDDPDDQGVQLVRDQYRSAYKDLSWDIWFEQPDMEYIAYAKKEGELLSTPFVIPNPPQDLGQVFEPSNPQNLEQVFEPSNPQNLELFTIPSNPTNLKVLGAPSFPTGLQSAVINMTLSVSPLSDKTIDCNGDIDLSEIVVKVDDEVISSDDYSVELIPSDPDWNSTNGEYNIKVVVSHVLTPPSQPRSLLANVESIQKPAPPRTLNAQVSIPVAVNEVGAPTSVTVGLSRQSSLVTDSLNYQNPVLIESLYRTFLNTADGIRVTGSNYYGTASQGAYSYSFTSAQYKIMKFYADNNSNASQLQLPLSYWTDRNKLDIDEDIEAYSQQRLTDSYYEFGDVITLNSGGQIVASVASNPFQTPVTHDPTDNTSDHYTGNTLNFNLNTLGSWVTNSLIAEDTYDEWKEVISNRFIANVPESESSYNPNTPFVEEVDWNENETLDKITNMKILFGNTKEFNFNNVTSASCQYYNSYLVNNGELWGIGENRSSQMGSTTNKDFYANFKRINTENLVVKVVCSRTATMFIDDTNALYAMGDNTTGVFGIGSTGDHQPITQVANDAKDIIFVGNTAFLLKQDGTLWFSGDNSYGWFDTSTITGSKTVWTQLLTDVDKISGQMNFVSVIKDSKVFILGNNALGERGLGNTAQVVGWTEVDIEGEVVDMSSGFYHTLALTNSGDIYTWGGNTHGQCGVGAPTSINTPLLRVSRTYGASPENSAYINDDLPVQVKCGGNSSFYVTEEKTYDGSAGERTLWGMGDNFYGQLASTVRIGNQNFTDNVRVLQLHGPTELKKL